MIGELQALYSYRELIWIWTMRSIRVRYKQSVIGGLWSIVQPFSLMVVYSVIFSNFVKIPVGDIPYPIFSYTALLPWAFFTTSIGTGVSSLVNNINLVTKIYFPREILPLSSLGAAFFDFLVASSIFILMILFYQIPLKITMIVIPVLIGIQFILTMGIVFLISALNVFYRDIHFIIPLAIQIWMFASPIIYPVSIIPQKYQTLYMLNPMAGIIEAYRDVVLRGLWPDWRYLGFSFIISILTFSLGYLYFKKNEWKFADLI
jgi:lipopolysaccharide transport system permease protein